MLAGPSRHPQSIRGYFPPISSVKTLSQLAILLVLWLVGIPHPAPRTHTPGPALLPRGTWGRRWGPSGTGCREDRGGEMTGPMSGKEGCRVPALSCGKLPGGHHLSSLRSLPPARTSSEQNPRSLLQTDHCTRAWRAQVPSCAHSWSRRKRGPRGPETALGLTLWPSHWPSLCHGFLVWEMGLWGWQ